MHHVKDFSNAAHYLTSKLSLNALREIAVAVDRLKVFDPLFNKRKVDNGRSRHSYQSCQPAR
jgi:hypothetical protein